jgi:protein-L-isoaspartate O-methyltransferase
LKPCTATLAPWIDALELAPGSRVLHVGAGLGYYTAVMAQCVGARNRDLGAEDNGSAGIEHDAMNSGLK